MSKAKRPARKRAKGRPFTRQPEATPEPSLLPETLALITSTSMPEFLRNDLVERLLPSLKLREIATVNGDHEDLQLSETMEGLARENWRLDRFPSVLAAWIGGRLARDALLAAAGAAGIDYAAEYRNADAHARENRRYWNLTQPMPTAATDPLIRLRDLQDWCISLKREWKERFVSMCGGRPISPTPDDLIPTAVAVRDYSVSRHTLARYIQDGKLRDYRPKGARTNAPFILSRTQIDGLFPKK